MVVRTATAATASAVSPVDPDVGAAGVADPSWRRAFALAAKSWLKHRCPAAAAAVSFYLLVAFFPAVAAFGSVLGLLGRPEQVEGRLAALSDLLPADVFHLVVGEAPRFAQGDAAKLAGAAILSAAFAVGAGSSAMRQLMVSLNIAGRFVETRHWTLRRFIAVLFSAGLMLGMAGEVGVLIKTTGMLATRANGALLELGGKWLSVFALSVAALSLIYRLLPNRPGGRWRRVAPGSVAAAAVGLGGSLLLSLYLAQVAHYQRTYGGLGALLGLAVWMWMAMATTLAGAELNYALEHRAAGTARPPHMPDGPR